MVKKFKVLQQQLKQYTFLSFAIAWGLMIFNTTLYYSNVDVDISILSPVALLFFGISFISTEYSKKELLQIFTLVFIGILCTLASRETRLLWLIVVISCLKNIDIKKIFRVSFYIFFGLFCLYLLLFLFGMINETITQKGGHSLGLGHPNTLHCYILIIITIYIYLKFKNYNLIYFFVFNILNILLYLITLSRSGFVTLFFVLLYSLLIRKIQNKEIKKRITIICTILILLLAMFEVSIGIFYSENIFCKFLDSIFTGRLSQANFYYKHFGISIFGRYLEYLSDANAVAILDIGFLKLLLNNGIVSLLLFLVIYLKNIKNALKRNQYDILILLISTFSYTLVENVFTYVFMNVSFLYSKYIIFGGSKKNDT